MHSRDANRRRPRRPRRVQGTSLCVGLGPLCPRQDSVCPFHGDSPSARRERKQFAIVAEPSADLHFHQNLPTANLVLGKILLTLAAAGNSGTRTLRRPCGTTPGGTRKRAQMWFAQRQRLRALVNRALVTLYVTPNKKPRRFPKEMDKAERMRDACEGFGRLSVSWWCREKRR